jgi:hypothetical protein
MTLNIIRFPDKVRKTNGGGIFSLTRFEHPNLARIVLKILDFWMLNDGFGVGTYSFDLRRHAWIVYMGITTKSMAIARIVKLNVVMAACLTTMLLDKTVVIIV